MKTHFRLLFFTVLIFVNSVSITGNTKVDSLLSALRSCKIDTMRVNILRSLSSETINTGDFDDAKKYADSALILLEDPNQFVNSTLPKNWKKNVAADLQNMIGIIHWYRGEYNLAMECYYKALKIHEESGNRRGEASAYNNIGNIHHGKGEFDEALRLYFKAAKLLEDLQEKQKLTYTYNNIGIIYSYMGVYEKAAEFYSKSLKVREELGDKKGMADSYNSLGILFDRKGEIEKALGFHSKSFKLRKEIDDKQGMAATCINVGNIFMGQAKYPEAKMQLLNALDIAKSIGYKDGIKETYSALAICDSAVGNFRGAYEYHKFYSFYKDSIFNAESAKSMTEMQTKYESEKKDKEIIQKDAEINRQNIESEKRATQRNALVIGLALMVALAFFIFRGYRQKKAASEEIARQKQMVDEKQKEILDSFHYAKRIQKSLLTSEKYIEKNMNRLRNQK